MDQYTKDPVHHINAKMLSHVWSLLVAKKEQERTLLSLLVNKFGHIDKKIASKVVYLLQQLLVKHPMMKLVVAREVEMFLFRHGVADRAKYYAIVGL
jgi:ribosome biogenesis protein MAK21